MISFKHLGPWMWIWLNEFLAHICLAANQKCQSYFATQRGGGWGGYKCLFVLFLNMVASACSCNPNFVPANSGKILIGKKIFVFLVQIYHISNIGHLCLLFAALC